MTAITAFLRKTPITRLKDYFTAGGFTSLPPIDWAKPEPEVVEPLVKAVDGMSEEEKQRVILDAGRVAALADEPGQNALQNVVLNRAVFDTLEGANNRSLWVFLKEPDRFRLAEEVRYNDERRRGRSWNGFEVEKDCTVRRDPISVAAFTKAIRDRFEPRMSMSISSTGIASSSMTRNAIWCRSPSIARDGRKTCWASMRRASCSGAS